MRASRLRVREADPRTAVRAARADREQREAFAAQQLRQRTTAEHALIAAAGGDFAADGTAHAAFQARPRLARTVVDAEPPPAQGSSERSDTVDRGAEHGGPAGSDERIVSDDLPRLGTPAIDDYCGCLDTGVLDDDAPLLGEREEWGTLGPSDGRAILDDAIGEALEVQTAGTVRDACSEEAAEEFGRLEKELEASFDNLSARFAVLEQVFSLSLTSSGSGEKSGRGSDVGEQRSNGAAEALAAELEAELERDLAETLGGQVGAEEGESGDSGGLQNARTQLVRQSSTERGMLSALRAACAAARGEEEGGGGGSSGDAYSDDFEGYSDDFESKFSSASEVEEELLDDDAAEPPATPSMG